MMFLHVTTRIPDRKDDGLLRKVGSNSFPTFVALSSRGEVLAKPRHRSIASFDDAMSEAAELEGELAPAKGAKGDDASSVPDAVKELMRKLENGLLIHPVEDRAAYLACRDKMSAAQRARVEEAMDLAELALAQEAGMQAQPGTAESDRAMLAMLAVKERMGGRWPMVAISNRCLITLMRWAERNEDPRLYQALFDEFVKVRRALFTKQRDNEAFIEKQRAVLDRLWKGRADRSGR